MEAFSELKGLADLSDSYINKTKNHNSKLKNWFDLFKKEVEDIVANQNLTTSKTNDSSTIERKLPDILSFVCETETAAKNNLRVSSALACLKKDHILHEKRTTPVIIKTSARKTRSKSSQQDQPGCSNTTFVKFATPENNVEKPVLNVSNETSINSVNGEDKQEFYTPVGQNPEISECQTANTERKSSKRKSSSPLVNTANVKKVKQINSETVAVKKSVIRKSLRGPNGKLSESKFFKYHNRLPSAKISGSGVSSVLKENRASRLKSEAEDQPMKKVLAARQLKAQEAKRKREEKMQKNAEQRMKLEKEKDERLRSRKAKETEKPLIKTVLDSKKKRTREVEKNHSEGPNELYSAKKVRGTETGTPVKTPRKKATEKLVEKENKSQKPQQVERVINSQIKSNPPTQEILQNGTPAKTPRKVVGAVSKEVVNKNEKINMNKTYVTNPSNAEEKNAPGTKAVDPVKEVFKTPVAPQRTVPVVNGSATVSKPNASPLTAKQKPSLHVTANSQSYEMTPARESFVNYDISEIKSDDSDDDENVQKNHKPVPGWAAGVRLKNALVQQQYRPIDTDLIFGNVFTTPNLEEIMGVKSKRYFKRTSSAVWNSPSAFK